MKARPRPDRGRFLPSLLIGDIIVLILFNAHGMASHQTISGVGSIFITSIPTLIAWLGIGLWLGLFWERSVAGWQAALSRTLLAWVLTVPIKMQLRVLLLQRGASWIFALVFFTGGAVYLLLWRTLYTLAKQKWQRSHAR